MDIWSLTTAYIYSECISSYNTIHQMQFSQRNQATVWPHHWRWLDSECMALGKDFHCIWTSMCDTHLDNCTAMDVSEMYLVDNCWLTGYSWTVVGLRPLTEHCEATDCRWPIMMDQSHLHPPDFYRSSVLLLLQHCQKQYSFTAIIITNLYTTRRWDFDDPLLTWMPCNHILRPVVTLTYLPM